jgi:E3 ubiquitin-protein ligase RNF180
VTAANNLGLYADGLEDDLTCRCCFQTLDKPSIMWPCGHSFCKACIEKDMAGRDSVTGDALFICRDCGARCHEGHTTNVTLGSLTARWNFKKRSVTDPSNIIAGLRAAIAEFASDDPSGVVAEFLHDAIHTPLVHP